MIVVLIFFVCLVLVLMRLLMSGLLIGVGIVSLIFFNCLMLGTIIKQIVKRTITVKRMLADILFLTVVNVLPITSFMIVNENYIDYSAPLCSQIDRLLSNDRKDFQDLKELLLANGANEHSVIGCASEDHTYYGEYGISVIKRIAASGNTKILQEAMEEGVDAQLTEYDAEQDVLFFCMWEDPIIVSEQMDILYGAGVDFTCAEEELYRNDYYETIYNIYSNYHTIDEELQQAYDLHLDFDEAYIGLRLIDSKEKKVYCFSDNGFYLKLERASSYIPKRKEYAPETLERIRENAEIKIEAIRKMSNYVLKNGSEADIEVVKPLYEVCEKVWKYADIE